MLIRKLTKVFSANFYREVSYLCAFEINRFCNFICVLKWLIILRHQRECYRIVLQIVKRNYIVLESILKTKSCSGTANTD